MLWKLIVISRKRPRRFQQLSTAKWTVARKGDSQRISPSQWRRKAQIPRGIANSEADTCLWPACQDPLRLRGIKQRACRPRIFALASRISQTVSWRRQNYDTLFFTPLPLIVSPSPIHMAHALCLNLSHFYFYPWVSVLYWGRSKPLAQ